LVGTLGSNRPAHRRRLKEAVVSSTLSRPRNGRVIAGVCAGLADRYGMSPFVVRLLFVLSCLLPGPQFVIYLVLWMIMPSRAL
jgi:phage shock protein C